MVSRPFHADPVLPAAEHDRGGPAFGENHRAAITAIHPLTATEKLYQLRIIDPEARRDFSFRPGQFVMLELPGIGEAPFSISSSPLRHGDIELCIRAVGDLTNFLGRVPPGTVVGLSGPFGTSFPMERMENGDLLLIAGGLGLAPLRAPIFSVLENRFLYKRIDIIYGAKNPEDLLFRYQYDTWRQFDIGLHLIVDRADAAWQGPVGLITDVLRQRLTATPDLSRDCFAIVCGPPVMFRSVCDLLIRAGMPMERIFVSLERRMHCGRGKCCRCNIGSTYTCLKGPVFDYWSVLNMKEAI